jgi:hypothetical protein
MTGEEIAPLRAPLAAVEALLDRLNGRGVIIGGVAVTALGAPRFTADVDVVLLLSLSRLSELMRAAAEAELLPRIENAELFARRNRVLLLRHEPSGIAVDVSLGMLPFEEEVVTRSELREFDGLRLRLPTVEDLIVLKAVAHRPKDLADIAALAQAHPELDRKRIEHWVREFGAVLEMPDLWDSIRRLL